MKLRYITFALALLSPVALTQCATPVSVQTPAGKTAYTADQIVKRVDELQNATIQANQSKAIPDATAVMIVKFCVSAAQTLKATPAGWQQTVIVAWGELKKALLTTDAAKLSVYLSTVDLAIASLIGAE